jgi:GNAT superfamily N-acetyltransferase
MQNQDLKISFAIKPIKEIKEKILQAYKEKYENDETEKGYVSFFEKTLNDAENGLTLPYLIFANDETIGVLSLSAGSIKVLDIDWELYKDFEELPAVRIDLFLIFPPFRGKRLGSKALDELIAFLNNKRWDFIGYSYIITLSTNERFDNILLSRSFKPLITEEEVNDKVDGILEQEVGSLTKDYATVEILRKDLKKTGIWFYLKL